MTAGYGTAESRAPSKREILINNLGSGRIYAAIYKTRGPLATETKTVSIASSENEWVKGLGLTSATTLVMGSMIGSGIFIVSAEIAREVNSPALLIAAWLVTGFMTVVAALSYGELAA